MASVRPPAGTTDGARWLGWAGAKGRRGRHRADIGWFSYRSAHRDPERSRLTRLLPAWRYGPIPSEPTPPGLPPTDSTPRVPDITSHDATPGAAPTNNANSTGRTIEAPPYGSRPNPRTTTVDPRANPPIHRPLRSRSATVPKPYDSAPAAAELTESQVLPFAHPADGSSLSALLGFSETEAKFGEDWMEGNGSIPAVAPPDDDWNRLLSLRSVRGDPDRRGNTGDAVKLLWDATAEVDMDGGLLSDGFPDQLALRSSRRVRWSLVVSSALLAVLIAATVQVVRNLPGREAEVREVQYAEAARQLSGALVPIEQSLDAEGLLTDSGVSTLTGQINVLDGAARAASTLASEQLPRAPIVGSRLAVDELRRPKRLLESASIQALDVGQRIGDAMSYSLSLSTAFQIPALPTEASLTEVDGIAEQLSISIAKTSQALTALPDDHFFGTFRQRASDTVTMVEGAQADYITALRDGDTTRAADASAAMYASFTTLQEGLQVPLSQVQTWALGQIAQLRSTVDEIASIVAT